MTSLNAGPSLVVVSGAGQVRHISVPSRGRVLGRDARLGQPFSTDTFLSRHHVLVRRIGYGIEVMDLGSANGTFVNGVQVRDAVLHPDDQIAFDQNRFLLEAPSLPTRAEGVQLATDQDDSTITQTMRAVPRPIAPTPPPADDERNKNDSWWLIGAAALIAIGIGVLFYVF